MNLRNKFFVAFMNPISLCSILSKFLSFKYFYPSLKKKKAGSHWGFSMSIHDMQTDPINSSPEAKAHFMKGNHIISSLI